MVKKGNYRIPIGTPVRFALEQVGVTDDLTRVFLGGPMMGAAQANTDTPLLKGTSGVIVLAASEVKSQHSYPCISCGHCLDACPVFLNPQLLGKLSGVERYEEMEEHHLQDCMLCGCCSYVCPSNIPLSQQFAAAKVALRQRQSAA